MKITPKVRRGAICADKALVEINDTDAIYLASLLSYGRSAGGTDTVDGRRVQKMLNQLAAACEFLNAEANTHLEERTADYVKTMKLFDPGYGGSS